MLEECALPYSVVAVDIGTGDQFKPDFLATSPNNKSPRAQYSDRRHRDVPPGCDRRRPLMDDKARSVLFGAERYQRH